MVEYVDGATIAQASPPNMKGPKIDILRYKNKTGYRRRQGFRAQHTRVKITAINI